MPIPHSPIRWHGSPLVELDPSPVLGADTAAVLGELVGLDAAAIEALADRGVVGAATPS